MVTEQMKTDAQRFGNGKKGYNIKQVAEMLENAGGGYTAGDGITISEDKVISAIPSEFTLHESNDWSDVVSDNVLLKDIFLKIKAYYSGSGIYSDIYKELYLPKGFDVSSNQFTMDGQLNGSSIVYTLGVSFALRNIFTNANNVTGFVSFITIDSAGSGSTARIVVNTTRGGNTTITMDKNQPTHNSYIMLYVRD